MAQTTVKTSAEVWKNSSLYEGILVSSHGRIKEKEYRKVTPDCGGSFRVYDIPSNILTPRASTADGALVVSFRCSNHSSMITERVDKLVATEFVENTDPQHYNKIKYLDGDMNNVKSSNLSWTGSGIFAK